MSTYKRAKYKKPPDQQQLGSSSHSISNKTITNEAVVVANLEQSTTANHIDARKFTQKMLLLLLLILLLPACQPEAVYIENHQQQAHSDISINQNLVRQHQETPFPFSNKKLVKLEKNTTPNTHNTHSSRSTASSTLFISDSSHSSISANSTNSSPPNVGPHIQQLVFFQCHELCAQDGESCWGPGPDDCMKCSKYRLETTDNGLETGPTYNCVDNCTSIQLPGSQVLAYDAGNNTCKKCHQECAFGCLGTEARDCWECKNVKDGPNCISECPINKYNNNGVCEECDKRCLDGCTGPSNKLGLGGCNSCGKAIITHSNSFTSSGVSSGGSLISPSAFTTDQPHFQAQCIRQEEPCPEGFYQEYVGPQAEGLLKSSSGKPVCRKCHHRCKTCTSMGTHVSVCECASYVAGEQCEDYCPRDYFADEQLRHCIKCSSECNGCTGPTEADCINCRVYRIYYNQSSNSTNRTTTSALDESSPTTPSPATAPNKQQGVKFNCTAQCPPSKPHRISESNMLDPYCSEDPGIEPDSPRIMSLMNSTYIFFMLIISGAVMVCSFVYRCQLEKDKTVKLTMHLSGIDDVEPLTPSNLKPNLAPLRSIKETELRIGKILGEGFGGKVFQGLWCPEDPELSKGPPRPVAVKMLRDHGQSNKNKEFLNEAYNMASVNHPNVVRLIAICMTPKYLMLVTQLMPLGCLLQYVQANKNEIGSKNLLEWCKQIAKGMAYLEGKRMVHRDLALRNILLQTCGRALISDFGLAKLLDFGQSEYQSGGGRLPIKWLAPECIRERKFTHKSDVWAFGVTVWELLTFGAKPFEKYNIQDVPIAIEEGARLPQPEYMSAEVYKVMFECWFPNADDRPDFKDLAQNFVKFARDPQRYLICKTKGIVYIAPDKKRQAADLAASLLVNDSRRQSWSACSVGQLSAGEADYISADEPSSGDDDLNSSLADQNVPMSAQPDLTPSTHNRLNEMFRFDMQRNHYNHAQFADSGHDLLHEKEHDMDVDIARKLHHQLIHHQLAHQHLGNSKTHLVATDANNNNLIAPQSGSHNRLSLNQSTNGNRHWTLKPTFSTNSLSNKLSEQPTDMYDYLLPSPCTDEVDGSGHFSNFYTSSNTATMPITPTSASLGGTSRPPPHYQPPYSAGLTGITNDEYFMTARSSYVNQQVCMMNNEHFPNELVVSGLERAQSFSKSRDGGLDEKDTKQMHQLSASNGNVPQSLV